MSQEYSRQSKEFTRDLKYFTNEDICDYAHHILQKFGKDENLDGELQTSWYDADGNEYTLCGRELEKENPTYQLDVTDGQKINFERVYTISISTDKVGFYDDEGASLPSDDQNALRNELINYLRTYRGIDEPRINREGRRAFDLLAARFAVDLAIRTTSANMDILSGPISSDATDELQDRVITTALAQSVRLQPDASDTVPISEVSIPYTRSDEYIEIALAHAISEYKEMLPAAE